MSVVCGTCNRVLTKLSWPVSANTPWSIPPRRDEEKRDAFGEYFGSPTVDLTYRCEHCGIYTYLRVMIPSVTSQVTNLLENIYEDLVRGLGAGEILVSYGDRLPRMELNLDHGYDEPWGSMYVRNLLAALEEMEALELVSDVAGTHFTLTLLGFICAVKGI